MLTDTPDQKPSRAPKRLRDSGTNVVYPRGVERRYGISETTRWLWEKRDKLPKRDVFVAGKAVGWRPETLDAADRGQVTKSTT